MKCAILAWALVALCSFPALAQLESVPDYPPATELESGLASDDPNFLFWLGSEAIRAASQVKTPDTKKKYLTIATKAFQRILVIDPAALRPRLELARAFFLLEEDSLAREHFEKALAATTLPPAVKRNIQYHLDIMQRRKRWFFSIGAALAPDTNINTASEEDTLFIGGIPFRLDQPAKRESGTGLQVWGDWQYFHPLRPNINWRSGIDWSVSDYPQKHFDQKSVAARTGPQFLTRARNISVLAEARHNQQASQPQSDDRGLRVEVWQRLTPRLSLHLHAHRGRRTYRQSDEQDGPRWNAGARADVRVTPQLTVHGGLRYDRERPARMDYRNARRSVNLGGSYDLPGGVTVGLNAQLARTVFEPHWGFLTQGEPERKDRQKSYRLSLHHRGWTLRGFAPSISVIRDTLESNAQLQSYRRWHGEIALIRQF